MYANYSLKKVFLSKSIKPTIIKTNTGPATKYIIKSIRELIFYYYFWKILNILLIKLAKQILKMMNPSNTFSPKIYFPSYHLQAKLIQFFNIM